MIAAGLLARFAPYTMSAAAAVGVALLAWGGVQTHRLALAKAEAAEVRSAWSADKARAAATALVQATEFRAEETRRSIQLAKAADDADRMLTLARADADAAAGSARGLSERVAALVTAGRRAACNPATAGSSPPAGDPIGVLADVLGRADARAGLLARIADERGIAGAACVRAYEALTP